MAYAVVAFSGEEDDVAVVLRNWLINEKDCYWPPYRTSARIDKALRGSENPGPNWSIHSIRVLSTTGEMLFLFFCALLSDRHITYVLNYAHICVHNLGSVFM